MTIFDYELATFIPTRSIGSFNATVTIEESGRDEIEITQHPVQQGATISDHSFVKPSTLTLSVMWDASTAPLNETYAKLIELQRAREPIDVVTGKRIYKNMLIRAISQTTDATTENALKINLELQEIIITALKVTSVQANPAKTGNIQNTGTKSVQAASAQRKRSALLALVRG